jgi:cyclomaltodextrinase
MIVLRLSSRPIRLLRATVFAALALAIWASLPWATPVTFRYQPVIGGVSSVSVAGSFNGWDAAAHPLRDDNQDGIWEAVIDLPEGRISYKFVVNGDQWFADDFAPESEPDGFGGQNSVAVVGKQSMVVGVGSSFERAAPDAPAGGLRRVTFRFRPSRPPQQLSLAGTFNDWTVGRNLMTDEDGDGVWTTTLLLSPGEYQYKFVIDSDGWTQDREGQDGETDDGFGGKNSILRVDDRFPAIEVRRGDGEVFADGLTHTQAANEVNHLGGGRVEFTARAHLGDVESVDLVIWSGGAPGTHRMREVNRDRVFAYFRTEVSMPEGETPYVIRYRDGGASFDLTPGGMVRGAAQPAGAFVFDPARFPAFVTPEWVKHAVIYQIFPDRFMNGDPDNDQDFSEWYYEGKTTLPPGGKLNLDYQEYYHLVKDWNDYRVLTQAPHTPDGRDWMAFYGGDIEGVRQKLDYLRDLGVTAIYFNPIFEGKSTHKYDGADYLKVDPHFGTNEHFKAFVQEAKSKGIRIILDIVYNHSGNSHWAFRDAALRGRESPTWDWYEFKRWPLPEGWPNVQHPWKPGDYYYCWWGFGDLPDLNFDLSRNNDAEKLVRDVRDAQVNVGLVNHLLDATEFWLKEMDVDGVRLDVPNEVPYWFWKLFNERVKRVKPDAYIVGELWGNASDYVRPGIYDAVMNYAFFRDPVQRFLGLGQGTAAEFDATLASGRITYPTQAVQCQMNLIDSHDTVRFLTQVGGNVNRLKLAVMFAMTYVGAPHIYYGDEIGMEGGRDPDCRRPFIWDYEKEPHRVELLDYYKKLTRTRHAHVALRTGDFTTVAADGKVFGYVRSGEGEQFLVGLNAGGLPTTMAFDTAPWGGTLVAEDLLSGETLEWRGKVQVSLPGEGGRLFRLVKRTGR